MEVAEYRIKTSRWLFYFSCFQIAALFVIPALLYPARILFSMQLMAALTVGVLFAIFSLIVNIYGLFIDKKRKALYIIFAFTMAGWIIWAVVSWTYIEHMDYLLH
jgi:hypothetical protein